MFLGQRAGRFLLASSLRLALGFGFFLLGLVLSVPLDVRLRAVPALVDVLGAYELAVLVRPTTLRFRQVVPRPVPTSSEAR